MENKRTCPVCGDKIIGRIDKKFCTDQCRTTFNNRMNKDAINSIRRINGILRRNRRILATLNPRGHANIPLHCLTELGFDFRYFTNICRTEAGDTCFFCYDQGYHPQGKSVYALMRHEKEETA